MFATMIEVFALRVETELGTDSVERRDEAS
jgi:hypothetical protein